MSAGRGIGALLVVAVLASSGEGRSCEARVVLDPPEAWVGQQVVHEIVVEGVAADATVEWLQPPSFPDLRASLLPPSPDRRADPAGTRRQRRALHPARAGRLALPPTPFRCVAVGGQPVEGRTPAAVLVVEPPPAEDRPESWRGLVGRVSVQVHASEPVIHVGESVRLVATISGPGLVRQAGFAWPREALEGSPVAPELFEAPALHRSQPGLRLTARRSEHLDVVPHRPGELWVPAIEVAYLDAERGRYALAASEPIAIRVQPARPTAASSTGGTSMRREDAPAPTSTGSRLPIWLAAGALVAGLALHTGWRRARSVR